jgi:hypothetical protein
MGGDSRTALMLTKSEQKTSTPYPRSHGANYHCDHAELNLVADAGRFLTKAILGGVLSGWLIYVAQITTKSLEMRQGGSADVSAEQRRELARKAVLARWAKAKEKKPGE